MVAVTGLAWWMTAQHADRSAFSGDRAFDLVERQVAFGLRVPGSRGHAATQAWLVGTLQALAPRALAQLVSVPDPADPSVVFEGANVVASFRPETTRRIMPAAHWDTRAISDEDPTPAYRSLPVAGANDGGSGVAVLLEPARLMHGRPPPLGVDLVLFDLEDVGENVSSDGEPDSLRVPFAAGSERFTQMNPNYRPSFGVLLDMVGHPDLRFPKEGYSVRYAPAVVNRVWKAADRVGADAFLEEVGGPVIDDHVAFLRRGIPFVNVIQQPFPDTWHTQRDAPENVSAASLAQVGRVMVEVIYSPESL